MYFFGVFSNENLLGSGSLEKLYSFLIAVQKLVAVYAVQTCCSAHVLYRQ